MKHKLSVLTALVVLLTQLSALFVSGTLAQQTEDPVARIENTLNTLVDDGRFSGSVLIARDGEILLSKGYGLAVRQWNVPNAADTRFRIADQTEIFIATAVFMLQERGMLTLEDPICDYLATCPDSWQALKIRHLLSHTAGLPHLLVEVQGVRLALPMTVKRALELLADSPPPFEPGEGFNYGSDYIILGEIIKTVSGLSYQNFIQRNLLDPLALNDTGFENSRSVVERFAQPYEQRWLAPYVDPSVLGASLGMYSTVGDMYHMSEALHSGELVSVESWQTMSQAEIDAEYRGMLYGYGMFQLDTAGHTAFGDWGWGLVGYGTARLYVPDTDLTIIILSNLGDRNVLSDAEIFAGFLLADV